MPNLNFWPIGVAMELLCPDSGATSFVGWLIGSWMSEVRGLPSRAASNGFNFSKLVWNGRFCKSRILLGEEKEREKKIREKKVKSRFYSGNVGGLIQRSRLCRFARVTKLEIKFVFKVQLSKVTRRCKVDLTSTSVSDEYDFSNQFLYATN